MKVEILRRYDFLGVSSATLCLLHCLMVPFLSLVSISNSSSIWIDLFCCFMGLLAVYKIVRHTDSKRVQYILIASIVVVISSISIELLYQLHNEGVLIGGIGLLIGHTAHIKTHSKVYS